jgi:hypothetical protein
MYVCVFVAPVGAYIICRKAIVSALWAIFPSRQASESALWAIFLSHGASDSFHPAIVSTLRAIVLPP